MQGKVKSVIIVLRRAAQASGNPSLVLVLPLSSGVSWPYDDGFKSLQGLAS
jgi:hypothetical protein